VLAPDIIAQVVVSGILIGCIYALIALGLSLIFGVVDIVNFAHGEFLMYGMYITYWLHAWLGLDPLLALPITAVALFGMGQATHTLLISRVIEAPPAIQMFSTFGLLVFMRSAAQFMWTGDFRLIGESWVSGRLELLGIFVGRPQLVAAVVAVLVSVLILLFIERTSTGRALQAVAEDREAAYLMGIDSHRMYLVAWGIAAGSVGVAGALLATFHYVFPGVGGNFLTISFVVVALSGFGSVRGILVGGVLIGVIEVVAGLFILPAYKTAITFVIFLVVLIVKPRGLFGKQLGG
jgi:branched-chain amino acid transport system permease protein